MPAFALAPTNNEALSKVTTTQHHAHKQNKQCADACAPSAAALARFFTVLGNVAVQQLALSERLAKAIRSGRAAADRARAQAASDAAHGPSGAAAAASKKKGAASKAPRGPAGTNDDDDLAAQLGVGAVSIDELDAVTDEVARQVCFGVLCG